MFTKVIAVLVGLLMGSAVHFASRALGLQETVPGSLVACAIATAAVCSLRLTTD